MTNRKAFKDYFDRDAARALGLLLSKGVPNFDLKRFEFEASADLDDLEMMDRVRRFSAALRAQLPSDPTGLYAALSGSLPGPLPNCDTVMDGYLLWPVGQAIAECCSPDLSKQEVLRALECMQELTQRFSAEFAVRPYIEEHEHTVLPYLKKLTSHASPHVRRWCSEGTRPRLPWATHIAPDLSSVLEILERLRADPERYVQKSVANHLNDIAKQDPDLVLGLCERWLRTDKDTTTWIVRSALRTLIKQPHPRALALMGFEPPGQITCRLAVTPASLAIGDTAEIKLELTNDSTTPQRILVDYRVHYVKANGDAKPKVFKWTSLTLDPKQTLSVTKQQAFRDVSIRRLYPGTHTIDLQINGEVLTSTDVHLSR